MNSTTILRHINAVQRAEQQEIITHREAVRMVRKLTLAYYRTQVKEQVALETARVIRGGVS